MTLVVMDNLKCLFDHVSAHASADFIDACETLCKKLLKSMKIAKKFKEEFGDLAFRKKCLLIVLRPLKQLIKPRELAKLLLSPIKQV